MLTFCTKTQANLIQKVQKKAKTRQEAHKNIAEKKFKICKKF